MLCVSFYKQQSRNILSGVLGNFGVDTATPRAARRLAPTELRAINYVKKISRDYIR